MSSVIKKEMDNFYVRSDFYYDNYKAFVLFMQAFQKIVINGKCYYIFGKQYYNTQETAEKIKIAFANVETDKVEEINQIIESMGLIVRQDKIYGMNSVNTIIDATKFWDSDEDDPVLPETYFYENFYETISAIYNDYPVSFEIEIGIGTKKYKFTSDDEKFGSFLLEDVYSFDKKLFIEKLLDLLDINDIKLTKEQIKAIKITIPSEPEVKKQNVLDFIAKMQCGW